jgi:hypothetical protein
MANLGDILLLEQSDFTDHMTLSIWTTGPGVVLRSVIKADPLNDDTAILSDADGAAEEPSIGVVSAIDYPIPGQCVVKSLGILGGFVGLSRAKSYILSKAGGGIVAADDVANPDYPVLGDFKQTIGVARSATELMIMVDPTTFGI